MIESTITFPILFLRLRLVMNDMNIKTVIKTEANIINPIPINPPHAIDELGQYRYA